MHKCDECGGDHLHFPKCRHFPSWVKRSQLSVQTIADITGASLNLVKAVRRAAVVHSYSTGTGWAHFPTSDPSGSFGRMYVH